MPSIVNGFARLARDLFHNWGKLLIMSTENGTATTDKRTCHLGSKWLIVASGFICIFISDGMLYTYGILLVNLVEAFQSSRATTELVAAIYTGVFGIMGPLSGRITEEYGVCTAVIAGSLVKTVGLICSTFVTQLNMLFLTYGILVGLGDSLKTIASFYAVISNFHDNRTLANGIAYCGTGTGMIVFSILTQFLVDTYGWRGTFLMLAGLNLQGVVCGFVLMISGQFTNLNRKTKGHNSFPYCCLKTSDTQDETERCKLRILDDLRDIVWNNSKFFAYLVLICCGGSGYIIPFHFLPDQATTLNISKHNIAWLLTAIGIANIISRVVFGILGDRAGVSRLLLLSIVVFLAGIGTTLSVLLNNFAGKMVYSCLFGFVIGGYFTLMGVIVRDLVGTDKLALAYGLHEMAVCAGISVGGPIGGLIFDKTGSYMPTFVFAGAMMILGGVIGFIIEGSMKRKTISSDDSVTRQESPQSSSANM